MWKLDLDVDFFRVYDKDNKIAGYFAPEYGDVYPEDKADKIIEQMHKNKDKIPGGYLTVPMVKFGIFDSNEDMSVTYLKTHLADAAARIEAWDGFLSEHQIQHAIRISHTDHDMLSLTIPIKFAEHTPLDKKDLKDALSPTLDMLQQKGLL